MRKLSNTIERPALGGACVSCAESRRTDIPIRLFTTIISFTISILYGIVLRWDLFDPPQFQRFQLRLCHHRLEKVIAFLSFVNTTRHSQLEDLFALPHEDSAMKLLPFPMLGGSIGVYVSNGNSRSAWPSIAAAILTLLEFYTRVNTFIRCAVVVPDHTFRPPMSSTRVQTLSR